MRSQRTVFADSPTSTYLAGQSGFEPETFRLTADGSTVELMARMVGVDGVAPPEDLTNCFTDSPATTYSINSH